MYIYLYIFLYSFIYSTEKLTNNTLDVQEVTQSEEGQKQKLRIVLNAANHVCISVCFVALKGRIMYVFFFFFSLLIFIYLGLVILGNCVGYFTTFYDIYITYTFPVQYPNLYFFISKVFIYDNFY